MAMQRLACLSVLLVAASGIPSPLKPESGEVSASLVDMGMVSTGEEASMNAEQARLWEQFSALDERFASVARDYMHKAMTKDTTQAAKALLRKENENAPATEKKDDKKDAKKDSKDKKKAKLGYAASFDKEFLTDKQRSPNEPVTYGFYLHTFYEAAAVVNQMRQVRKYYPEAPVYVMTDGGGNFTGICKEIGNCKFAWRSGAHDCWNPKPFLDRFHEGATWLQARKANWTIFLEPDVTLHKRATYLPEGADAGGLRDMWNSGLPETLRSHMTELGRNFSGNKNFTLKWDRFGFCGGSIMRTKAAVISFKPNKMDWKVLEQKAGGANQMLFSSDVAMLVALGSHGFNYYPWEDVSEGHDEFQPKHQTAFVHHSKNEKGGKPLYGKPLPAEDMHLVEPPPKNSRQLAIGECQKCVWLEEDECWSGEDDGMIECPTEVDTFRAKVWEKDAPNFNLFLPVTGNQSLLRSSF